MSEPKVPNFDVLLGKVHDSVDAVLQVRPRCHPASLVVWPWPVIKRRLRVAPKDLLSYRGRYVCRFPACFCTLWHGWSVESAIYMGHKGALWEGRWMFGCAQDLCGYCVPVDDLFEATNLQCARRLRRRPASASDTTDQRHIHITERLVEGERKGMKIDDLPPLTVAITQTEPPAVAVPCVSDILRILDDDMSPGVPLEWFEDFEYQFTVSMSAPTGKIREKVWRCGGAAGRGPAAVGKPQPSATGSVLLTCISVEWCKGLCSSRTDNWLVFQLMKN
ncbi:hypothetical protein FIBSPDRAFT_904538 [Athelia psychrophila]|uniref:Uncharacterized protein n=1 Tax=Athelia psychrophila TaxID=1759441 RepID=A0A167UMB3_9AGAM|nr:hypothetical protein FIBSPDRAFT_904538 [Fibularhizoctonia sp. CBS 109695]